MVKSFTSARIYQEDKDKLMTRCKELFLKNHPHMKGMNITFTFLNKQAVEFFEFALLHGAVMDNDKVIK